MSTQEQNTPTHPKVSYRVFKLDTERGAAILLSIDEYNHDYETEEEALQWIESRSTYYINHEYVVLKIYKSKHP